MSQGLQVLPQQLVKQHNALINASYTMDTIGLRLFLAGLTRLRSDDDYFKEYAIPFHEILGNRSGGKDYEDLRKMCDNITKRNVYMEVLNDDGTRELKPDYDWYALIVTASYRKNKGVIVMEFHHKMRPYLLNLKENGNFTMTTLEQVLKIKSVYAFRLYWLLKEFAAFGQRRFTYDELRRVLDLTDKYKDRFNGFKDRVLDPARAQLASTDMDFEYKEIRTGRKVTAIDFKFGKNVTDTRNTPLVRDEWADYLRKENISEKLINKLADELATGKITLDYLGYEIKEIAKKIATEPRKVGNPAGYMYTALDKHYFRKPYLQAQQAQKKRPQPDAQAEDVMSMQEAEHRYQTGNGKINGQKVENFREAYFSFEHFATAWLEARNNLTRQVRDGQTVWVRPKPRQAPTLPNFGLGENSAGEGGPKA